MKFQNPFTVLFLALNLALSSIPMRADESRFSATSPLPRAEVQTAVFSIQYADVKALTKLLDDFSEYLGGSINCDVGSKTIAVVGSKELVAACTEAIRRLDVPPKSQRSIELTIYILLASKKPIPDGGCPPELQSFCGQMKGIFKGFKLLETISTRTVDGKELSPMALLPLQRTKAMLCLTGSLFFQGCWPVLERLRSEPSGWRWTLLELCP